MRRSRWPLLLGALTLAFGCQAGPTVPGATGEPLRVYAAASLVDLLEDLRLGMEAAGGHPVVLTTASSGTLARQILHGAPAHLYISADTRWMATVADAGLIAGGEGTSCDWLRNALVCIVPADAAWVPPDLPALAGPQPTALALAAASVPVGAYAREALAGGGVALPARLIEGRNARDTLAKVALGGVPAGIVYRTDARAEPRVRVAFTIDARLHAPIIYPAAVLARGEVAAAGIRVLAYLRGAAARPIIEAHGFAPA